MAEFLRHVNPTSYMVLDGTVYDYVLRTYYVHGTGWYNIRLCTTYILHTCYGMVRYENVLRTYYVYVHGTGWYSTSTYYVHTTYRYI